MLIDFESIFNLILQSVARQIGVIIRADRFMIMIIVNGTRILLSDYTIMELIVAGVSKVVQFFVVSGKISYSLILGRPWLRDVVVIEYYESDEYWIKGLDGNYNMLKIFGQGSIRVTKVYMRECCFTSIISRGDISVDDEVLIDFDYLKDEKVNAIIHEIEQKTQAEMEDDFEEKD